MTALTTVARFWEAVEPNVEGGGCGGAPHSCYSPQLKTDLVPGTFVLLLVATTNVSNCIGGRDIVARIVRAVGGNPSLLVEVNVFKKLSEVVAGQEHTERTLWPQGFVENHLRHIPEIVQTTELRVVAMTDITNLAFVFTEASLNDTKNFYYCCQGMTNAFLLQYRVEDPATIRREDDDTSHINARGDEVTPFLITMPMENCLPFPSCYENSRYFDCFARRIRNNIVLVKLEIMKLLGRYSQQQGLFGRECARLYLTAETWGFICLQCSDIINVSDFGSSKRYRVHRMVEVGLVVKAARLQKSCTIMQFSTKTELKGLCQLLGESVTAGQRCHLPKSSEPKSLWINDIINVVRGSDAREACFSTRTPRDGIDFEFDGLCELFITIRYSRYAFTQNTSLLGIAGGCDPLLYSLIARCNPYKRNYDGGEEDNASISSNHNNSETEVVINESDFEDSDGCLWRVTSKNTSCVVAKCIYPKLNNVMHGCMKSFDLALAKQLIQQRLTG